MRRAMLALALVAGCAKDTPPSPTVSGITLTSPNSLVHIGATEQITGAVSLSDGSSQPPGGVWTSGAPAIASVSTTGLLTGLASGDVTVSFTQGGRVAAKRFRVLPNYAGTWSGTYRVAACGQTGQVASTVNPCGVTFRSNTVLPYTLNLTQMQDSVAGRFFLGALQFDQASGPVAGNGALVISSVVRSPPASVDAIWTLQSMAPGALAGAVTLRLRDSTLSGEGIVEAAVATGARSFSVPSTSLPWSTLGEALRLLP
jgi:hypothetical protein